MNNKKLKYRITFVMAFLLAMIYLTVLISVNIFNYSSNLKQQRREIRSMIQKIGMDAFREYPRTDSRLEDVDYCTVCIDEDRNVSIICNYLSKYSDEQILKYSEQIVSTTLADGSVRSLVYVIKAWREKNSRVILFMSNDFAIENSKNLLLFSIAAWLLGTFLLTLISMRVSAWLISPIEKAFQIEKEFMSNASHELKTPLTIISANAELLKERYGDNRELSYIRQETAKMSHLIGEMLAIVRMDSEKQDAPFLDFDVSAAMMDVVLPFESVAFENHLSFDFAIGEHIHMHGSQDQLKSVMSILLDNAMCYTPEGGSVNVEVSVKNKKLYMKVTNTGEEITEEMQEKIFERFYRKNEARTSDTQDEEGHFGLGLSIAHEIVLKHRGKISVKSKDGYNVFTVVLPMTKY